MIERVYYRVKLDANTFIYTPYLSNIPKSITDIPTNVTYDTTDGITLKADETWTYDNGESAKVTTEREIPMKAGDGVTMDVSEDGEYIVIKVDPKRETHIGTSVPTDDYPDLFVNTADDSLSYKAPDGSWKPIAGGSGGGLVDDVQINGQSIVENKVANIVVDTALNARSSNPVANSLLAAQVTALGTSLMGHTNNKDNPHSVTKVQVGLGNVNNTSDANKPVSTAQQVALDKKIDKAGGTFSGNVAIQGNLTVSGTTTTESEKQLAVKENVIVTNADKANLQTMLSGLAINKNSTATYGIMYDPADDTVKFGEGTLDANRKFVFEADEGHPLAIRADSSQFTAGHLVKWDATKKQLVDAGKDISEVGKTPKSIDAVNGNFTNITYDTVDGLTLVSVAKIINTDDSETDFTLSQEIPLLGSANISIDLDEANQKLVFSLDKLNDFLLTPFNKVMGVGNATRYLGFTLTPDPKIKELTPVGTHYYTFETGTPGNRSIICKDNLKTINGNSIVGFGDIPISGGSIDADTLNGLLSAGEGISIGKTTTGNKVKVKLDPASIPTFTEISVAEESYQTTIYSDNIQVTNNEDVTRTYVFPAKDENFYTILTDNNVKTLFGNQSIVGSGNIDLYRHHILCSTPNAGIKVLITVISSKNLKVDSLTDLKTLLGNTFECPCIGYAAAQNQSLAICNENGFLPIDIWVNVVDPTPDVTWSNIESIIDTVTTV